MAAANAPTAVCAPEAFDEFFGRVLDLYHGSPSPLTRAIADSGWLHLESLVWRTTANRLVHPEGLRGVVGDHVERYAGYLTYLRQEGRGMSLSQLGSADVPSHNGWGCRDAWRP